ncbi:stage V sporulation protein AF [Scopulibacillus darangshiensis]|uniref:Stage V sporulation protein AF n=1 Tax=Scopulibacillus darangshiensis TaxID=442528 RepID=A0A4R2PCA7_9BACL|nr:spore germination protein [Scopulibacillus darangshiensis]TCP31721.1 stage V sporulation protein AF [Scopulibacillus darangshiensis]
MKGVRTIKEKREENKEPINKKLKDNENYMKERLDVGAGNFDVGVRNMEIFSDEIGIYYCNSLVDSSLIVELIRELLRIVDSHRPNLKAKDIIKNHLAHEQVKEIKTLDESVDNMLSGLIVILIDGEQVGLVIDVRHYPGRSPEEPDVEKVIRGSKDGFTENIIENAGLMRRRVRDERYRNDIMQIGERSKTDVCLCYLKDVANPGLLKTLKSELKKIEVDGIPMADKTIEEYLVKQGINPYPLVRYTGRPDVAAAHILEGHILLITDTSPSIIIFPTTLFHHVQHAEEYRQTPSVGAFLRWVRFIAMLASIFLVPLWLLLVENQSLLPPGLDFIGPNKHDYHIPLIVQILIAEIGVETLRMAAIHTPTSLSTALGLIAAVLVGQIAVQVGIFVSEVILYVAVSAIGAFATPSYELSVANKITRILLILVVGFFHVPGFVIFTTLLVIYLARVKNLNTPYLWPFIPFNPMALFNILVRTAMPLSRIRPSIVKPLNKTKQPTPNRK